MSVIFTKLNLVKGMRRKRARQRIVLRTDFLNDWLILCLMIERERLVEFLNCYPFPLLIMSIRDCTPLSRFTLGNCGHHYSHSAQ